MFSTTSGVMKHYDVMGNLRRPTAASVAPVIACPVCNARLAFHGGDTPHIDECGFESYHFECMQCGGSLGGIVDPYDETLLLSQLSD
jgi:hypothetical protein